MLTYSSPKRKLAKITEEVNATELKAHRSVALPVWRTNTSTRISNSDVRVVATHTHTHSLTRSLTHSLTHIPTYTVSYALAFFSSMGIAFEALPANGLGCFIMGFFARLVWIASYLYACSLAYRSFVSTFISLNICICYASVHKYVHSFSSSSLPPPALVTHTHLRFPVPQRYRDGHERGRYGGR